MPLLRVVGGRKATTIGVVGTDYKARDTRGGDCRVYNGDLTFSTTVREKTMQEEKRCMWEIGCRYERSPDSNVTGHEVAALVAPNPDRVSVHCPMVIPAELRGKICEQAGRMFANQPEWERCDFAAVVRVLGGMLAACTFDSDYSTRDFLPDGKFIVRGANVPMCSWSFGENAVYVPKSVDSECYERTWAAITCAINICGSGVITENLEIKDDRVVLDHHYKGRALWNGCCRAVNIFAGYFEELGMSDVFSIAFTSGLHSVATVVAHSDEGGCIRDVLRNMNFCKPYGAIPPLRVPVNTMTVAYGNSVADLQTYVDGLLLSSAATVAHSDPMIKYQEKYYPTFISSARASSGSPDLAQEMLESLNDIIQPFSALYSANLSKLYGLNSFKTPSCLQSLFSCACSLLSSRPKSALRHFNYETMVPYFWVEPTCLLSPNCYGSLAEEYGSGSLGDFNSDTYIRLFEDIEEFGSTHDMMDACVKFTSLRKSGLMLWLGGHKLDGCAQIVPVQIGVNDIINTRKPNTKELVEGLERGDSIDKYMWTRGQSALPHPGEFLNIAGLIGVRFTRIPSFSPDYKKTALPNFRELLGNGEVCIRTTRVGRTKDAGMCTFSDRMIKWRGAATRSLANVSRWLSDFGDAKGLPMVVSTIPPSGNRLHYGAEVESGVASVSGISNVQRLGPETSILGTVATGAPVHPSGLDQALRAPRRVASRSIGGGVARMEPTSHEVCDSGGGGPDDLAAPPPIP